MNTAGANSSQQQPGFEEVAVEETRQLLLDGVLMELHHLDMEIGEQREAIQDNIPLISDPIHTGR